MNKNKIKKILEKILDEKIIDTEKKFSEYKNWDSLLHMNLLINLREKYNININSKNIKKMQNYSSIIKMIKKYEIKKK